VNVTLDDDALALRALAAQVLSARTSPDKLERTEATPDRFDADLWADLAQTGLLGAAVPEVDGGLGMGLLGAALVCAEVGRTVAPVPYVASACSGAVLARCADDQQRGRLLSSLLSGERRVIVAPPPSVQANVADGRINGTLLAVPWAHVADALLVAMNDDVVLVDPTDDGVVVTRGETTARQVALDIALSDVEVELVGGAEAARLLQLSWWTLLAAMQAGVTDAAVRLTASYTSSREQFGKPLSTFQGVALQAADAYVDSRAIEAVAMQAAWSIDAQTDGEQVDATLSALTAAWWASEAGQRCVHLTQHLHGGMGADITYPVHRYFLHGKQIELMCGAASSLLEALGDALADRPHAGDAVHL
jgi:alkylation response protein AidB-like acyl-CoA dehydrogenase